MMHIEDKTRIRYNMQDGAGIIPMVATIWLEYLIA